MIESQRHLLECLARDVLKRPLHDRRRFLAMFEEHNGKAITEKLKELMQAEWEKKKNEA